MKVVVNKVHGGFGLSHAGEKSYLERKGLQQFLYTDKRDGNLRTIGYERYTGQEHAYITYTFTKDHGDEFFKFPENDSGYFYDRDIPRNDPDLVVIVEAMGHDANGRFSKLEIVDIPDGVEWEIEEYDGLEWVAEKHRTW